MALAAGLLAQTPVPQPTFRTEANYVRVDVFPTAKDGKPVLDLTRDDFEVLESRAPQKLEQFEHVVIRGANAADLHAEPNTVREARAMLENTRARVFVIFLDLTHVTTDGSHRMRQPLITLLDRLIGPDDLVGVMTPEMAPTDIAFARKTTTIEGFLTRHWYWGEALEPSKPLVDPTEQLYESCYGPLYGATPSPTTYKMIARRREKHTIDALQDLVSFLHGVREERKAIIDVSDGFSVMGPDNALLPGTDGRPPTGPQIGVDPRTGKPTTFGGSSSATPSFADCERDRMTLAQLDDRVAFQRMLDSANRANASFYPINPQGLVGAFGASLPPGRTPSLDRPLFGSGTESLRALAENTDGLAIVNTNDLEGGVKRIVDDLSSYYLLGYYSTGKLDGRFHPISVRVKRPDVRVRARRGYLALTPGDAARAATVSSAATVTDPAAASAAAAAHAVEAAIAPLPGYARDAPLRLQVAAGWKPGDTSSAAIWVVGELGSEKTVGDTWNEGFDATVTLTTSTDATVGIGKVSVPRDGRTFRVLITPSRPLAAGDYMLRVGARAGQASIPSRETVRLTIPAAPDSTGALFLRRAVATGNKEIPTANLQFRRNEQIRVEIPTASSEPVTARLLDRTGKALAVPVTAAVRDDADGSRWATAQLALAPLAAGDYVIEMASGDKRMISAFRVVP